MKNKIHFFPERRPKNSVAMEKKTVFQIFDNILMKNHANLLFFLFFFTQIFLRPFPHVYKFLLFCNKVATITILFHLLNK